MIAYVQPIFCPNEMLFVKNLESVKSFVDYYVKHGYTFKCVFGGYSISDEYFTEISNALAPINNKEIIRYDKNYGKAYIVNDLATKVSDVEYFLTADSDIKYLPNQPNMMYRLLEAVDFTKRIGQEAGVIALLQLENNCHIMELCTEYVRAYVGRHNPECISRPHGASGMAGGCVFVNNTMWKKIGGYKILGVYAGDDANLMLDCVNSGLRIWLSQSIACIHPADTDPAYSTWKSEQARLAQDLNVAIDSANNFFGINDNKDTDNEEIEQSQEPKTTNKRRKKIQD